jgi:hypothetical protein
MKRCRFASIIVLQGCAASPATPPPSQPVAVATQRFSAAGELLPPTDYRSWVFLTAGFAMAYGPTAQAAAANGVQMLDNVFVERGPYEHFLQTGAWPEATLFVLEVRSAEHTGSIVTEGHFQTDLAGIEAEVKDTARFPGGWGFFSFDTSSSGPAAPAQMLPRTERCYACHAKNAAVENTFTQFYPTLFPVARAKGTVRKDFVGIPPTGSELFEQIVAHGWDAAKAMIDDAAAKWPAANLAREVTLHKVGDRLLQAHKAADAVALLADITRRFPGSAKAWDSLADAYEGANQLDPARQANTHGLAIIAADPSLVGPRKEAIERSLKERDARLAKH